MNKLLNHLQLKLPPPLLALLFAIVMWLSTRWVPVLSFKLPFVGLLSGGLGLLSLVVGIFAVIGFKQHHTTVDPRHPERSQLLVTSGIYAYSRNPMYLALIGILLSFSLSLSHWLAILMIIPFILALSYLQIKAEEKILTEKFGQAFISYCAQVRRWL